MFGSTNIRSVYLINGLLESGKTEFINFTLEQPYFKSRGTTLLIVCEEGEIAYKRSFLRRNNIQIEVIEEEEQFTKELLLEFEKKYNPERIIIEYNGMWNHRQLPLPNHFRIEQQVTIVDASTFGLFYNNMKSIIGDMVRNSELVLFNRADNNKELASYKRNIKLVNQKAEIVFEGAEGEIALVLEEELPFDIKQEVIEISEDVYATWFLDALENTERYVGKCVKFIGQVLRRASFPKGYFVPIREVMTCCEDDIAKLGFVCQFTGEDQVEGSWVQVTAVITKEYFADYGGEGPVLHATAVEQVIAPKNRVLDF